MGSGIRQNAEKAVQTADAFVLNSGESSYLRAPKRVKDPKDIVVASRNSPTNTNEIKQ